MKMDRRAFMKALAAACGMAALPSWAEAVAQVPDPPPVAANLVDPVKSLSNWVVQVSIGDEVISHLKASNLQVDTTVPSLKYAEYGGVVFPTAIVETTRELSIQGTTCNPNDAWFNVLQKEVLRKCLLGEFHTLTLSVYQESSDSPFLDPLFTIDDVFLRRLSFDAFDTSLGEIDLHYSATFILNASSKLLPGT